jgi:hypothetical protein
MFKIGEIHDAALKIYFWQKYCSGSNIYVQIYVHIMGYLYIDSCSNIYDIHDEALELHLGQIECSSLV